MEYISVVDTAKMIRKALKEAFPDIKFSVKSDSYAGGASVRIYYKDGPNTAQVDSVVKIFEGKYFDGMIDYAGGCYAMLNGKQVKFGADYVFVNREYSDAFIQKALDRFYRKFAGNMAGTNEPVAQVEDYRNGNLYNFKVPMLGDPGRDFVRREVFNLIDKQSDRLKINDCPTASKIIDLGTDNYGQSGRQLAAV